MINPIAKDDDPQTDWQTINACVADINGVYSGTIIPSLFGKITRSGDSLVIDLTPLARIIESIQAQLVSRQTSVSA